MKQMVWLIVGLLLGATIPSQAGGGDALDRLKERVSKLEDKSETLTKKTRRLKRNGDYTGFIYFAQVWAHNNTDGGCIEGDDTVWFIDESDAQERYTLPFCTAGPYPSQAAQSAQAQGQQGAGYRQRN